MNKITQETVTKLMDGTSRSPAVTIYLPTHKISTPPNMREDQVRFKNLISKAQNLSEELDEGAEFNKFFEKEASALLENQVFWQNLTESLLICARPGMFEYFHLPIDSDEYVAVDTHFHLAPILGLLSENQNFYILSVNQKEPFLLEGDMYGYQHSRLELPRNVEEALNIDEMHLKNLQHASVRSPKGAEYHGHGAGKDTGQAEHQQFQKIIDDKVAHYINDKSHVILAGTDSELGEYRAHTKLKNVIEESIHGSFTREDADQILAQATEIVRRHIIEPQREEVLSDFSRLEGQSPDQVEANYAGIQDAAEKGKVGVLALGMLKYTTDTVRDNVNQVVKLSFPNEMTRQAFDNLAQQVWRQGGKIVNLYSDQMPRNLTALAINRY